MDKQQTPNNAPTPQAVVNRASFETAVLKASVPAPSAQNNQSKK